MAATTVVFAAIPAVIYLGAGLFPAGMTIGTLVAFTALQAGLFRPITGLLNVGVSLVWTPCPRPACGPNYSRPLFNVADNGSFLTRLLRP
jgi:hypothetical protein